MSTFDSTTSAEKVDPVVFAATDAAARISGRDPLAQLTKIAAECLCCEAAYVGIAMVDDPIKLQTAGLFVHGQSLESQSYAVAGTPCAEVLKHGFQTFGAGDALLQQCGLNVVAGTQFYAGAPIVASTKEPLGVLVVLCRTDLPDLTQVEAVLNVLAARVAAEVESKRGPAAVQPDTDLYRLVFEASIDGLALINRDGIVVDVNRALGNIDGYSREEVIGQFPPRYRAAKERAGFLKLLKSVIGGKSAEAKVFLPHKNGSRRPVETRSVGIIFRGDPHMLVIIRDLSERVQHEGELRRSEDLYRAVFDASVDGLVVLNTDGLVVDVNPAVSRADGFSREELVGQFPPSLRDPSLHERQRKFVKRVLAEGRLETEGELLRKDGQRYTAEMRSVRIDYHGEPHVLVVVRDISERRNREIELQRSEQQYRTVFEGIIDGLVLINAEGIVVDANQAMLDMDGFERSEVIGKLPPTYTDRVMIDGHREFIRRALASEPLKNEFYFKRKDGSRYYGEVRPIPIIHNNEPHALLLVRDISEQKAQHAALTQSEDRLRATIATALDSIIAMDEAGKIIDFNPAAEACFGYTREEVIGRALDEVVIPPNMRKAHRAGLKKYLATGEGPYLGTRIEVEAMRKDGAILQAELAISVAGDEGDKIFIGYLRDISEQKRAAEQSERLEAQLRQAQKMEAIGHLTGGVAHDFNNILTSILGYVTLARDYVENHGDEKLDRYLDRAERAGGRARDLIAQMLTFSRGQQGERKEVNLASLVEESLTLLESSLPASIEMTSEFPQSVPPVSIDPVHFEQILVNLCINARDAMNGAGSLAVSLGERRVRDLVCSGCRDTIEGRFAELSVTDNGPGIEPAIIERIFEPFFTTKDVGKGSGMGLSTVHGIVHDHDGHAIVDSTVGRGTTLRVLLPISHTPAAVETDVAEPISRQESELLDGHVLVVDDSVEVGEYIEDLLNVWGLEVSLINDPIVAKETILKNPTVFDLVITDQTMPRLNGLELATAVHDVAPDLPIFLYTGYSESVTEEIALAAGVRAFLEKPLDTSRLRALVREVLG